MIISKAMYNEMLDLINEQRHRIEDLEEVVAADQVKINRLDMKCQALHNDKTLLLNMLKGDPYDIDFPNSHAKGGNVVNTHLDSRDNTSHYPTPRHNGNIDINDIFNL